MSQDSYEQNQNPDASQPQAQVPPEALRQRLAALNRVTMALTRSTSVDELCRNAVTLGIRDLDFDRLGLFFVSPNNPYELMGKYGTDRFGEVVSEHGALVQLPADNWLMSLVGGQLSTSHAVEFDVALFENKDIRGPNVVGIGWNAGAALWDGEKIIGYLLADNLLRKKPYTEFDGELLSLYAGTIGHLCLRLRVEESLRAIHDNEYAFRTRLVQLNCIATQLMRAPNLDSLYQNVIELGRRDLGFDRLGLWVYGDNPEQLVGTYGTWLDGTLKDERHLTLPATLYESRLEAQPEQRTVFSTDTPLTTPETDTVGHGWSALAALYDGEEVIGYLSTDNLLKQQPYHEMDGELLTAYAHMIGPLITRQRIAERLRERQADYQALLDAIPDMLFVLTKDGIYQKYYAPDDEKLYVPPEFFIGKHVSDVLPPPLAEQVMDAIAQVTNSGGCVPLEYTLPAQDEVYSFDARFVPVGDRFVLTLVRDVTEHKQLEEQLIVSQKMESLGRMASGIAHDFNNVLTVIQGYASMIQWQIDESQPKLKQALVKMIDATAKGMNLTQQLLSFARKQVVVPQVIDVRTAIWEMESMIRQILGDEITFHCQTAEVPLLIKIDPVQFEQILLNMTVNARDAMTKGDMFSIVCEQVTLNATDARRHFKADPGQYVLIRMRDTGIGIEEELLPNIFEPFFTTKSGEKGSGLGLSICHGIVEQSGGYILVESTLSVGTEFQIFLPAIDVETTQVSSLAYEDPGAQGETILVVEDDPIVCELAADILRSKGYAVLHCTSGKDALRCFEEHPGTIDLLMTDIMMPEMNGLELAEAAMHLYPELPVLMVSGYAGNLPDRFLEITNVKFLAKPYRANELATSIQTALHEQT